MMTQPLVAVSTDVRQFENYTWHAAPRQYLDAALTVAGVFPLLVPSFGGRLDLDELLSSVDGVLLTGSKSNVFPGLYGGDAGEANGPYDHDRDATTLPLIRRAIDRGVPLLAICRGMQELNVALGGSLDQRIQDLPGRMDHSTPSDQPIPRVRTGKAHGVRIETGGALARVLTPGSRSAGRLAVNSLHNQGVQRLAPRLVAEAWAPDGTVEAVRVEGATAFAIGVQWHPEYDWEHDADSRAIFLAFGQACADHRAARSSLATIAQAAE